MIHGFHPGRGIRIAQAYAELPVIDEHARHSFECMAEDEHEQYWKLSRTIDIRGWTGDGQPYVNSEAMRKDVAYSRHLYVFLGGSDHPCRDAILTFRGRAVHDILGHCAAGSDFSPDGELAAFRAHARHYSEDALPAVASDNLGQTAYYYFAPENIDAPAYGRTRVWPEQKMALLPDHLWRDLL